MRYIRLRLSQTFTRHPYRRANIKVEKALRKLNSIDRMIVIANQSAYATLIHLQTTDDSEETAKAIIKTVADIFLEVFHKCECYGVDENGKFWFDEVKYSDAKFEPEHLERLYHLWSEVEGDEDDGFEEDD